MVMVVNFYTFLVRDGVQVDLKHKLKCLHGEHKSVGAALEIQCRENIKVSKFLKSSDLSPSCES